MGTMRNVFFPQTWTIVFLLIYEKKLVVQKCLFKLETVSLFNDFFYYCRNINENKFVKVLGEIKVY